MERKKRGERSGERERGREGGVRERERERKTRKVWEWGRRGKVPEKTDVPKLYTYNECKLSVHVLVQKFLAVQIVQFAQIIG